MIAACQRKKFPYCAAMKKQTFLRAVFALVVSLFFFGCESGDDDGGGSSSADDLNISHAQTLGTRSDIVAQNATITRKLHAADVSDGSVVLAFDELNWPVQGGGKKTDGTVHLFWKDGDQVVGGSFDAHAVGQTVKGLENVYGGYLGKRPAKGATVYFCMVSHDNAQRTNVKKSATPW